YEVFKNLKNLIIQELNDSEKQFLLDAGWVLKKNQKYRKKGSRKQIAPHVLELLKAMFMADQKDHSQQNSAKKIFDELSQMAKESILNPEKIPLKQTIQSWIE
ncbi:1867_t:CDS:2, partial [Cetraspora pellucida]